MSFNQKQASKLLASCHRRCCVCHRFCGVKIELHHMEHVAKGGSDDIENAIPLCFECHAEVNHYNDEHPRGRKFTSSELLKHKSQWIEVCKKHPEALISAPREIDVGPLEGMIIELEHNMSVVNWITDGSSFKEKIGATLHDGEYKRAVAQGSLLLLPDDLRTLVSRAYANVGRVITFIHLYSNTRPEGEAFAQATNRLLEAYRSGHDSIKQAKKGLSRYLLEEDEEVGK